MSGLPDGIFLYQKSILWDIEQDLGKENFGILNILYLEYFTAIWCILRNLVYFKASCRYLVSFSRFGISYQEQSGNPG
jgi:hypothetical protein